MDKFDEIWKNKFNEEVPASADWLTPSDKVWSGIEPSLPSRKRRFPLWWLWTLLGGVAVLSVVLLVMLNTRPNVGNFPVYTETNSSPKSQNFAEVSKPILNTVADKSTPPKPNQATASAPIYHNKSLFTKKRKAAPAIKKQSQKPKRPAPETVVSLIEKDDASVVDERRKISLDTNTSKGGMEAKQTLPSRVVLSALLLEKSPLPLLPDERIFSSKIKNIPPPKEARWKGSVQTGGVYWQHHLSTVFAETLAPFDFHYNDSWGWTTQLQAHRTLQKGVSVSVGLQFEQVQVMSGHNGFLEYHQTMESATALNTYQLALATPYGFMDADFALHRISEVSQETVGLMPDFNSEHQLQNWSLPLGLTYQPWHQKNSRLQPIVGLQVGVNYMHNVSNTLNKIDTHHGAIEYVPTATQLNNLNINNWYMDVGAMGGVTFRYLPDINMTLRYTYRRGLQPVFESRDFTTHIHRHYVMIGVQKKLE